LPLPKCKLESLFFQALSSKMAVLGVANSGGEFMPALSSFSSQFSLADGVLEIVLNFAKLFGGD
jgi:hypothetical protein